MVLGSERQAVQRPLIRYAVEAGWKYLPPEEALRLRKGDKGIVLHDVLARQLQRLNKDVVDVVRAEQIIREIERVHPSIEGNLRAWEYLKGLRTVFVEVEKRERNLRLLDPRPQENIFHVTDELRFTGGRRPIRADAVFFINGIPVILVETKSATNIEGISESLDQIRRYHEQGAELMAVMQLYALTQLLSFYYGATWNTSAKNLYSWRDEQAGDFETLVKTFFSPSRVLRVLTEYILFTRRDGELSKVVLRPHQMRAAERVLQRCRDPSKRRGLVWHTQGSGKTYTMITVAKRLLEDPAFGNPTVLMIVDRNELEQQLFGNLESVGIKSVTVARSKRHLRELLQGDHRGLIVSMIHKFDDIPAEINLREDIFVLVDEAHRSTGGDLGNYLMGALPNATYIGFTGTPIDRTSHGKGTFKVFGGGDPRGYLDKYSIRESIEDGSTVPLHYSLAPNELRVERDVLEREFLSLADIEGVSDIEELNRALDKAVVLKNMLKSRSRIDKVARFVADHFMNVVEPMGYKAFMVAVDREACVFYKQALDMYLPEEYSKVVISSGPNDPLELARYHLTAEQEEMIRKEFRRPDSVPRILIVTEKLLTGFDAPILYCMYLDKPMRDHVLLQAIARVNRPYEDENGRRKSSGFILDFVGVFENLERALAFDSEDVKGVLEGVEVLQERFRELMADGRMKYMPLIRGRSQDKAVESILEHFREKEARQEFYRYFQELQDIYEILSPDPFLRQFMDDYEELARMYRVVWSSYEAGAPVSRDFLRKTERLVQTHTGIEEITLLDERCEITPEFLNRIAEQSAPDTVKVFNLLKAIRELVKQKGDEAPYLIPIGERAEQIARSFEERQKTTEQVLRDLKQLANECNDALEERKRTDLSTEGFTVYWLLNRDGIPAAKPIAREIAKRIEELPHWAYSEEQKMELRRYIMGVLIKHGIGQHVDYLEWIMKLLGRREG